jgi:hypothetical protein
MGIIGDAISSLKNAFNVEDTSKEARLTISIVLSMSLFFGFLALSGDFWAAFGLMAVFEIVLLYAVAIF